MPQFSYKAIGRDGRPFNGVIEADGLELASRQLRGQGVTLLSLEAGGQLDAAASRAASGSDVPDMRPPTAIIT